MKNKREYSYDEIDGIVLSYKENTGQIKNNSLTLLIEIFHPYFLKYIKLLKNSEATSYGNRDVKEFLGLFSSKANPSQTMSDVKRNIIKTLSSYTSEDLYNEFVLLFITLLNRYEKREGIHSMRYFTRFFRYYLRNWIVKISKDPMFHVNHEPLTGDKDEDERDKLADMSDDLVHGRPNLLVHDKSSEPMIDLAGLDLGCLISEKGWLIERLTSYQRYLLYLRYKCSLSCVDIAKRLNKNKDTISSHLKVIVRKLKRISGVEYGRVI